MRRRTAILLALVAAAAIAVSLGPPIPQSPAYHAFADDRALGGVANALNVLSNAPFVLVGLWGLAACRRRSDERGMYAVFFAGITLTGLGSGWYHLAPDHERLVWDRLPMTVGFMALLAATLGERVSLAWARRLLVPLLLVGVASVLWWIHGERAGRGDLRPYILVQFLSLIVIAGLLAMYPRKYSHARLQWYGLGAYALAKLCESYDRPIFAATGGLVSGHTLKHLVAAAGLACLAHMLAVRTRERPDAQA
ncbi:MAG: ceramidase domain-containing protein [Myxococcales bacterium]|nr:ceramidase domain-containing protein [Myxococcales bacterium]